MSASETTKGFDFRGVIPILATPFDEEDRVDLDSVQRLVDWEIGLGIQGLVCCGVAGEVFRLSADERAAIVRVAVEAADGRVPIVAGVTATGTTMVADQAETVLGLGGAGMLLAPPPIPGVGPEAIHEYYVRIADAVPDLPIVVQDEPNATGVKMSAMVIADIIDALPSARAAKIEDPPTARKIGRIREFVTRTDDISYLGGLGGQYLLAELREGAAGAMTGFAFPEVLLDICQRFWNGDLDGAREEFYRVLPAFQFEFQPVVGLAIRKEVLRRRGAIRLAHTRHPGPSVDPISTAELTYLLDRLELLPADSPPG